MKPTPEDVDREGQPPSKPPLSARTADEGNIPGRPSPAALALIVAVLLAGLGAMYFAG